MGRPKELMIGFQTEVVGYQNEKMVRNVFGSKSRDFVGDPIG